MLSVLNVICQTRRGDQPWPEDRNRCHGATPMRCVRLAQTESSIVLGKSPADGMSSCSVGTNLAGLLWRFVVTRSLSSYRLTGRNGVCSRLDESRLLVCKLGTDGLPLTIPEYTGCYETGRCGAGDSEKQTYAANR